jgi:hypothetical protein
MNERDTQAGDGELGVCHMCGRRFPTQEDLSGHLMEEHEDDGLPPGDESASRS